MDFFDFRGADNCIFNHNVAQNQSTSWRFFGDKHSLFGNVCFDINILGFYYLGNFRDTFGFGILRGRNSPPNQRQSPYKRNIRISL
jgi:hypothetical protein